MYKLNDYNVKLTIRLDNGAYIFDSDSSTGKTRLYYLLRDFMAYGENVYAVSYDDILRKEDVQFMINQYKPKLILFDRFDIYIDDKDLKLIKNLADTSIILVDYKGSLDVTGSKCSTDEICTIEMSLDEIEVYNIE